MIFRSLETPASSLERHSLAQRSRIADAVGYILKSPELFNIGLRFFLRNTKKEIRNHPKSGWGKRKMSKGDQWGEAVNRFFFFPI